MGYELRIFNIITLKTKKTIFGLIKGAKSSKIYIDFLGGLLWKKEY